MEILNAAVTNVFCSNCYLVASADKNCVIIDPGAGEQHIISLLETRGWSPKMIFLTHGHFDHVGAVKSLQAHYPGLTVYMNRNDLPLVSGDENAMLPGLLQHLRKSNQQDRYILTIDHFFADGERIQLDELTFTVLETPGHSPGSVCLACGDALFTGDTLFHHDVGRTDLFGGSPQQLYQSIRLLSALGKNYTIYPGHEEYSTIDEEADFFREFLERAPW